MPQKTREVHSINYAEGNKFCVFTV